MSGSDTSAGNSPKGASRAPSTEEQIRVAHVGGLTPLVGPIQIVDYDPEWPRLFEREARRIRAALGDRALLIEHVGSTVLSILIRWVRDVVAPLAGAIRGLSNPYGCHG